MRVPNTLILAMGRYSPISLEAFDEQVYSQFYHASSIAPADDQLLSHRQSVLFMVFAIGSLMNPAESAYNIEAEKYHQLARAALFSNSLFEELTVNAIQALVSFLTVSYIHVS